MDQFSPKIKCSVGILTLNSENGLRSCLKSLRDFAEVIVCDGNSSDRTREIAREYGAKVISQYESNEPDLPCVKDKAAVRQKAMEAATRDWYFYMDADDTLSPEVVEEIRAIASDPTPKYLVYRMPTRIFFEYRDGSLHEIKHEATYPSYQTRLVHRSVGAYFRGEVHDRLAIDGNKFPVGTMAGYYNFHWPEKRLMDFWSYLGRYADWELETSLPMTLGNLLFWGIYRRARTIIGYLLWRLPFMYARYGTKNSMPLGIELTIVRYHSKLLFGTIRRYMATRHWWIYVGEVMRGKDTNRILTNLALMEREAMGSILDIGGGKGRASHYRFLRMVKWNKIMTVDISPDVGADYVLDLEKDRLPFAGENFDYVFLMNVLEHLNKRKEVLEEIRRVLKSVRSDSKVEAGQNEQRGRLLGVIPFLVNVHPDPHDFVRLTSEGLAELFKSAGYSDWQIEPVGRGPFTAGYYQFEFALPRFLRLACGPIALFLDWIMIKISRKDLSAKFPLSYIFVASK
jgi:glycosyltransferase involved in cell wall biosynthesis